MVILIVVAGDWCSSQAVGKRRGEEADPDRPPCVLLPAAAREPRATSDGGACTGRAATVPGVHVFAETFPADSMMF